MPLFCWAGKLAMDQVNKLHCMVQMMKNEVSMFEDKGMAFVSSLNRECRASVLSDGTK